MVESSQKNIEVKNAEGDHDTVSEVVVQNQMDYTPKVSIIIPVYNAAQYLRECLDSLVNQTLKDIEIICVNDCSIDNSLQILEEYAKNDNKIIIVNNKKNTGAPGAVRNIGMKYAQGSYIGFIDSDDYVDLDYFEILYNEAIKNNADLACSLKLTHLYSNKRISKIIDCPEGILSTPEEKSLLMRKSGSVWNKIYRKSFIKSNGILCHETRHFSEDNYFSMISMCFANKIITTSKPGCYYYRHHECSMTSGKRTDRDFIIFNTYKAIDKYVKNYINDKNLRDRYLKAINTRKIQDFEWFKNDCHPNHIDAFKKKLKIEFPDIYSKVVKNDVIISLTSYPARINTANQTIETLLNQSMKADKVILWLAPEQFPNKEADLPKQLLDLRDKGLTIDWYHDIKSYKKLIPTLKKYPDAIIVTADDDNLYEKDWLKKLYQSYLEYPYDIQCHRVTMFFYNQMFQTKAGGKEYYKGASFLNKLVGFGGVLYPPHCFYKDITNEKLFQQLAPTNDDQWFWIQANLNNVKVRVVANPDISAHYIPGSQEIGLTKINDNGQKLFWKDFNRLMKYYPQAEKRIMEESKKNGISMDITIPYKKDLENWWLKVKKKTLNLDNPKTFNEKIQWLKLYDSIPIKTRLADKYLVRDWIKEKIGEQYLIPLLGVYDRFEDIDFDKLPNQFVIKCNHGCGYNVIIKDKTQLDLEDIKTKLNKWMSENFAFKYGFELHYRDIQPKIIIEKYIENQNLEELRDYKFYCFGGKVKYVQVISERVNNTHKTCFYDLKWKKQKWWDNVFYVGQVEKPKNFDEMIKIAKKLCQKFSYVRVDLYYLNNDDIYFGEMTFTPASGTMNWSSKRVNQYLGSLIHLQLAYNIDTGKYYKLLKPSKIKPYLFFPYYLWKVNSLKKKLERSRV